VVDVRGKLGAHVPKAQGLKRRGQGRDHATQKAPEECDRQMEKLTDRLSAHYSKIIIVCSMQCIELNRV